MILTCVPSTLKQAGICYASGNGLKIKNFKDGFDPFELPDALFSQDIYMFCNDAAYVP